MPHFKKAKFGWLFLFLFSVSMSGQDVVESTLKRLFTVETFAFGGVGYAGMTSKGEMDFRVLISQSRPTALAAFDKLYAEGNPQAKAYALAGIKKLNPTRFHELMVSSAELVQTVQVERGCIVSHEPLQQIAKQIDRGKFQF